MRFQTRVRQNNRVIIPVVSFFSRKPLVRPSNRLFILAPKVVAKSERGSVVRYGDPRWERRLRGAFFLPKMSHFLEMPKPLQLLSTLLDEAITIIVVSSSNSVPFKDYRVKREILMDKLIGLQVSLFFSVVVEWLPKAGPTTWN